ncbi:MAG: hypothetical protein GTO00_04510 [Deltaproteobacteria bacterium]|nr:hypothetical protein [Deltaproteobacteria bacterium]
MEGTGNNRNASLPIVRMKQAWRNRTDPFDGEGREATVTFWFMASYVALLVVGVGVGIWHYKRCVPKRYGKSAPGRDPSVKGP